MPYLKFSRDKRGYEHFSIIEPGVMRRGKPSRPRLLFWFRSPPQVKVGRNPFTDEVRRAIEAQNPGVRFDWPRLLATPIPPPDAEHWRERRRIEKAAKQAAREAEAADDSDEVQGAPEGQEVPEIQAVREREEGEEGDGAESGQAAEVSETSQSGEPAAVAPRAAGAEHSAGGGRRRRRRGRRKPRPAGEAVPEQDKPNTPVPPTDEV